MTACLFMAALNVCAQTKEKDSLRVIDLQGVSSFLVGIRI